MAQPLKAVAVSLYPFIITKNPQLTMTLTDILDQFHVEYRLSGQSPHVTGSYVGCQCPYCGVGTNKFGLGLKPGRATCWKCGSHNFVDVLMDLTGEPYRVIADLIREIPSQRDALSLTGQRAVRGKLVYPAGVGPLLSAHKRYLVKRGFDPDQLVEEWGIGGIGAGYPLSWRIFVPIRLENEVVSWTTRTLSLTSQLRYIGAQPNQEKVSARSLLYGSPTTTHSIVLVEGVMDTWKIGPQARCCYGVSPSRTQVELVSRYPKRVVCFDSEAEAQRRADKLCRRLSAYPGNTLRAWVETGKDPGAADVEELNELRGLLG